MKYQGFEELITHNISIIKEYETFNSYTEAFYQILYRLYILFIDNDCVQGLDILNKACFKLIIDKLGISFAEYFKARARVIYYICWKYNLIESSVDAKVMEHKYSIDNKAIIRKYTNLIKKQNTTLPNSISKYGTENMLFFCNLSLFYLERGMAYCRLQNYSKAFKDLVLAIKYSEIEKRNFVFDYCKFIFSIIQEKIEQTH